MIRSEPRVARPWGETRTFIHLKPMDNTTTSQHPYGRFIPAHPSISARVSISKWRSYSDASLQFPTQHLTSQHTSLGPRGGPYVEPSKWLLESPAELSPLQELSVDSLLSVCFSLLELEPSDFECTGAPNAATLQRMWSRGEAGGLSMPPASSPFAQQRADPITPVPQTTASAGPPVKFYQSPQCPPPPPAQPRRQTDQQQLAAELLLLTGRLMRAFWSWTPT